MRGEKPKPPGLFRKILMKVVHARDREYALSDLEEEFGERCAQYGVLRARWWYRRQVLTSLAPALRGRFVRRPHSRRATAEPFSGASSNVVSFILSGAVIREAKNSGRVCPDTSSMMKPRNAVFIP